MQKLTESYQLEYYSAPWNTFRYTIKSKDVSKTPLYQVRQSSSSKYRQFEDMNENTLFYIGVRTIKSVDDEEILAVMKMDGRAIETAIGNFTLTHLNSCRRSYILKMNDNIIAQAKSKWSPIRDRHLIEMKDIHDRYKAFIFALLVLIDSIPETMQSTIHPVPIHIYVKPPPVIEDSEASKLSKRSKSLLGTTIKSQGFSKVSDTKICSKDLRSFRSF